MDFIRKYIFWIAVGLVCIAAIALQFVLVAPIAAKNSQIVAELNKRKSELQQFAAKKDQLHNQKWIEEEKKKIDIFAAERKQCEEYLLGLSKWYKDQQLRDEAGEVITDKYLWKTSYIDECNKLMAATGKLVHTTTDTFAFHYPAWGAGIPTEQQIAAAWLNYLVQKELVGILTFKEAGVILLRSLRVETPAKGGGWKDQMDKINVAIPFTLVVETDFEKLPFLIEQLVISKLAIVVRTVSVTKGYTPLGTRVVGKGDLSSKAKGKAGEGKADLATLPQGSDTAVTVVIQGHALLFYIGGEEPMILAAASSAPPSASVIPIIDTGGPPAAGPPPGAEAPGAEPPAAEPPGAEGPPPPEAVIPAEPPPAEP